MEFSVFPLDDATQSARHDAEESSQCHQDDARCHVLRIVVVLVQEREPDDARQKEAHHAEDREAGDAGDAEDQAAELDAPPHKARSSRRFTCS